MNFLAGQVLAFDKPYGITSFALVNKVRWLLTQRMGGKKIKVGHAGTLDPLATGVMVVCTGRATKSIDSLQAGVKEYVATLQLGATTPSYDLEHPIDATYSTAHITRALIDETLPRFVGEIMQVPPAFSACKVEGKRAYDLARRGEDVALRAKPLRIDEMEVVEWDSEAMRLTLRIVCSKGTYIRRTPHSPAAHTGGQLPRGGMPHHRILRAVVANHRNRNGPLSPGQRHNPSAKPLPIFTESHNP